MSMCVCYECGAYVDSDDDPECFVEVGNMKRLHQTKIICEACRELDAVMHESQDAREAEILAELEQRNERNQ